MELGHYVILTTVKTPEIEFNSMNKVISEIKLIFQVPSDRVNFHGQTKIVSEPQSSIVSVAPQKKRSESG